MSIEKKFLKSKPLCKVKFSIAGEPDKSIPSGLGDTVNSVIVL